MAMALRRTIQTHIEVSPNEYLQFVALARALVSRLAKNPTVSEQTIRALAGHVSHQMLSRYAHIRAQAKRAAIASPEALDFEAESPQNPPRSSDDSSTLNFTISGKTLN